MSQKILNTTENSSETKNKILNPLVIQGYGKDDIRDEIRYPVEDPEGIHTTSHPRDETDLTNQPGAVSLTKIEVLDLIGEGEIEGLVDRETTYDGTIGQIGWTTATDSIYQAAPNTSKRWLRSVFWNEVPVVNAQNQYNFQNIEISFTPGTTNGAFISLDASDELTVTRAVGERLRFGSDFVKIYRLHNKDIKAFEVNIRVSQLSMTDISEDEYGDTEKTAVSYVIYYRPLFSTPGKTPKDYILGANEAIEGKISQGYIRSTRVSLTSSANITYEPDFLGWEIKLHRHTPDSITNQVRNQTYIDSITEVFGDTFKYPNSAIVSQVFSAEYFSQIPARAFDCKLLKIKVPFNYNPILKQYTGDWDGTFKEEKVWSDNPAWCFYDLLTNKRYGLGKHIEESQVDKWTLYKIGQYCDTIVPDGFGGLEPRFTCNLIISSREEAYKVVNDMASIFRAMAYYFAGSIYSSQDSAKDPIYQFTNANVENGDFQYASSSRRARHTVAIVRYNDKFNFYKPAVEYVEDFDGIRRYGIRELELTAIGCTSRGQAVRLGRWALLSEINETETVTFVAGMEGNYLRPGDVIRVQDNNRTEKFWGGRIYTIYNENRFLLDRQLTDIQSNELYFFSVGTPSFNYDVSQVDIGTTANYDNIRRSHIQTLTVNNNHLLDVVGDDGITRTEINISPGLNKTDYMLTGNPIWALQASGTTSKYANQWQFFRVLRIEEQEQNKYAVSALQYWTGKFDAIDSGLNFETSSYSAAYNQPISLSLREASLSTYRKKIIYTWTVLTRVGITSFRVFAKFGSPLTDNECNDSTYLIATHQAHERTGNYVPDQNGTYYFRIYAINRFGIKSTTYGSASIPIQGIVLTKDLIVGGLLLLDETDEPTLVGGSKKVSVAKNASPTFKWQFGLDAYGTVPEDDFYYRVTIRQESNDNTPSKNIYFEVTGLLQNQVENLKYKFEFEDNVAATSSLGQAGPFRNYDVVVEAHFADGTSTAGGNFVTSADSSYQNSNGYDILHVINPQVPAVVLTYPGSDTTTWQTEQWINTEGEIKLKFLKNAFPNDMAGAYAYYSSQAFERPHALNLVTNDRNVQTVHVTESGNPFVINSSLVNDSEAYLAISFYDRFDKANILRGVDVQESLLMSNVVKITKRGDIAPYEGRFFYAWAEVNLSHQTPLFQWQKKSVGFSNIEPNHNHRDAVKFTFETPLDTNNYVVFATRLVGAGSVRIHEKTTDYFIIYTDTAQSTEDNTYFVGVLYNDVTN